LSSVGLAGDDKPFKAHITIGRAREERVSIELMSALGPGKIEDIGSQMVYSVAVVKSDLTPAGPIYTAIEIVPMGQAVDFDLGQKFRILP
jgi:2'-5' RNA ligase